MKSTMSYKRCDKGSHEDPFPDIAERVAWKVQGFFLACWLVLQDDVAQVTYESSGYYYLIKKDNLEMMLQKFLFDIDRIYESGASAHEPDC